MNQEESIRPRRPGAVSKWRRVAHIAAATQRNRIRFLRGDLRGQSGATHAGRPLAESVAYIRKVFEAYLAYGELREAQLEGRTVLELGPGDNLGVALLFVAQGAGRAVCLDKFRPDGRTDREREIYVELRSPLDAAQRRRFDEAVNLDRGIAWNPERIRPVYGTGVERADEILEPRQFDFIVSRAVLGQVSDPDRAFAAMNLLLKPGGALLHKIDLSDYGALSGLGCHPLEFLTIPAFVYAWMAHDDGRPNRRRADYYRAAMAELGLEARIYITEMLEADCATRALPDRRTELVAGRDFGPEHIRMLGEIRPRLAGRFRHLSDADLLTAGLFLTAVKTAGG
ncbi:MAG: methyltransferase domain-containing protein [Bryobacterales bacterium]|nr:methyltransferase domain-containing protein [Bryobacterales bacterium]